MTLRELDQLVRGRNERERADYRQLATLAYWLGSYWSKRPAKPDKLLGEKKETPQDAQDFIRMMNEKKRAEVKEEIILVDNVVTLDLDYEPPLDDWYWNEDDEAEVLEG
jgi:hypothetical protein